MHYKKLVIRVLSVALKLKVCINGNYMNLQKKQTFRLKARIIEALRRIITEFLKYHTVKKKTQRNDKNVKIQCCGATITT